MPLLLLRPLSRRSAKPLERSRKQQVACQSALEQNEAVVGRSQSWRLAAATRVSLLCAAAPPAASEVPATRHRGSRIADRSPPGHLHPSDERQSQPESVPQYRAPGGHLGPKLEQNFRRKSLPQMSAARRAKDSLQRPANR